MMSELENEDRKTLEKFLTTALRQYQVELVQIARQQNSIIFLPTGAGKTFIALHVLRSRFCDLKLKTSEGGKIAVFLGTTKPLVKQLATVIEENTNLRVKLFLGDMGVDKWSIKTWIAEMEDFQVLCMTPIIFLLLVQRQIVSLRHVTLLVLDECHHAVLNHPYNMIMKELDIAPENERPLILGLTSTVLNSNPEEEGMEEVEKLKRNLKSSFAKTEKVEDAIEYGTSPIEHFLAYDQAELTSPLQYIVNLLNSSFTRLERVNIYGILQQRAESIVPEDCTLLHNKNVVVKEIKNMFSHLKRFVKDLGLYATSLGVLYFIIRMERLKFTCQNPVAVTVIKYGITVLNLVRRTIFKFMQSDGPIDIRKFSSDKICRLIDLVEGIENKDELTCIIIVEERVTAAVLASLFNELCTEYNNNYYKADFVTGGMFNVVYDQKEALEEQKRMKDILRSFKKLCFHFLFATDVVEEGIDLPDCNVVIKFDEPKDYRSYVQCKGRARSKNSQFILFYKKGELARVEAKVSKYREIQRKLLKTLHSNDEYIPKSDANDEEEEEMFFLDGPEGMHISGTRAIQFLIRYCSILPQDNYSYLAPLCWYDKVKKIAYLQMPSSCPLQHVIEGDPKRNRKLAKKNVYLKAVKVLYKLGEISKDLTFRSYKCNEEDNVYLFPFFKKEPSEEEAAPPGTSKRKRTYEIRCAENLSQCLPQPGEKSYIHVIKITPKEEKPTDSRQAAFYELLSHPDDFAILSSKPLSRICDFPLFFNTGDYNCSLLVNVCQVTLTSMQIEKLKRFHFFIFHSLLSVIDRLQVFDNGNGGHSFLVIPVDTQNDLTINWKVVDKFVRHIETTELSDMILEYPTIEEYHRSVVYPKYRKTPCSNKYYIVTSLDRSQTALSKFPSDDFKNYYTYYEKKYQVKILNTSAPLLEVKLIPTKINYLKPRKSQLSFKSKRKFQEENETFQEHLVPELCCVLLVPSSLWLKATMLPSALYRITTISCIDDMRKTIVSETNLGMRDVPDDFDWEPLQVEKDVNADSIPQQGSSGYHTTKRKMANQDDDSDLQTPIDLFRRMTECAPCDLKHYVKYYELVEDSSRHHKNTHTHTKVNTPPVIEKVEVPYFPIKGGKVSARGPELCDFVKVFTSKSANDIIDLERLEFFGDSFLKFATAFFLFKKYKENEGVLVGIKDKIIGNRNLYYCAMEKGLQGPLLVNEFEPKSDWNAPLFCLPEEIRSRMNEETNSFEIDYLFEISTQEKLTGKLNSQTIKSIEEFVERKEKRSVYSIDQGFFGRKVISDKAVSDCVEALIGLYVKNSGLVGGFTILNWLGILPTGDGSYENLMSDCYSTEAEEVITQSLLNEIAYEDLENILGYKFKNKFLLLQALTHPSFLGGPTPSYQRLEFLGDSVLDFLMTIYIYHYCTKLSPGQMTDIRSALVNNLTFACLTVKYNIHKFMLHHSQQLLAVVSHFANFQKSRNDKIDTAVLVLTEEGECRLAESIEVPKALGDIFESIAGAIFLDSGNSLESVWNIFFGMMKNIIDDFSRDPPKSPIRVLYETCKPLPEFTCTTLDDGIVFTTCKLIYNDKEEIFYGRGRNTERSKLSAAKLALRFLEKAKDEMF